MPWGKLDDTLYDHLKLDRLGKHRLECVGLWAVSISWCNAKLTDGMIPLERIGKLGGTTRQAELLVFAGLFEPVHDGEVLTGYRVHDFLVFNDSREDVLARRAAAAERQRKARRSREQSQRDSADSHGTPPARVSRPDPARPGPTDTPPDGGAAPVPAPPKPKGGGPLAGILGTIAEGLGAPTVAYGVGEGEARVFAFLARNGAAIRPDSGMGRRLLGLIERRGYDVVLERAAQLGRNGPMSDRQWVFGLEEALEKPPSSADAARFDREGDRARQRERATEGVIQRRLETFRWTGRWDPTFGPEPKWDPAWGSRPA